MRPSGADPIQDHANRHQRRNERAGFGNAQMMLEATIGKARDHQHGRQPGYRDMLSPGWEKL